MKHCIDKIIRIEEEILDNKNIELYLNYNHEQMNEKDQLKDYSKAKNEKKKEWRDYIKMRKGSRDEKFSEIIKSQEDEHEIIKLVIEHMRNITNWIKKQNKIIHEKDKKMIEVKYKKEITNAKLLGKWNEGHKLYPKYQKPIQYVTKEYIIRLFEYSLRGSYKYLSYDTFLLKYGF